MMEGTINNNATKVFTFVFAAKYTITLIAFQAKHLVWSISVTNMKTSHVQFLFHDVMCRTVSGAKCQFIKIELFLDKSVWPELKIERVAKNAVLKSDVSGFKGADITAKVVNHGTTSS